MGELILSKQRFFPSMPLLPRKGVLAVAAVIDVAMQAPGQPISAKALAARHGLPPRHLEPVLQALVRVGILNGIRGPRGGYELARDRRNVTANDILRAAGTVDDAETAHAGSEILNKIVLPAMAHAEQEFGVALARISVEDMARDAQALEKQSGRTAART
jgi:Rrf2 family transcriptional regulator, iron-sulfur cluster assembly transcription factor